ncbi:plasmid SOS inhibition protein A [Dickeya parazeae]|uniref:plasmid SOS inhibition protein A n=1 Tax=Dickeya parazeae TaxID=2893572 RepID=UPI0012FC88C6
MEKIDSRFPCTICARICTLIHQLTGHFRLNMQSAQDVPGLTKAPKVKAVGLKNIENEPKRLICRRSEHCYSPVSYEVQQASFTEVVSPNHA